MASTSSALAARKDEGIAAAAADADASALVDGEAILALEAKAEGEEVDTRIDREGALRDDMQAAEALQEEAEAEDELATEDETKAEVEESAASHLMDISIHRDLSLAH